MGVVYSQMGQPQQAGEASKRAALSLNRGVHAPRAQREPGNQ
jgi:hypothetical protein